MFWGISLKFTFLRNEFSISVHEQPFWKKLFHLCKIFACAESLVMLMNGLNEVHWWSIFPRIKLKGVARLWNPIVSTMGFISQRKSNKYFKSYIYFGFGVFYVSEYQWKMASEMYVTPQIFSMTEVVAFIAMWWVFLHRTVPKCICLDLAPQSMSTALTNLPCIVWRTIFRILHDILCLVIWIINVFFSCDLRVLLL